MELNKTNQYTVYKLQMLILLCVLFRFSFNLWHSKEIYFILNHHFVFDHHHHSYLNRHNWRLYFFVLQHLPVKQLLDLDMDAFETLCPSPMHRRQFFDFHQLNQLTIFR